MLSKRLRQAREAVSKSQRAFAQDLGVSLSAWQAYETGSSVPGGKVFEAMCMLGYDAHWLVTGEGTMFFEPRKSAAPVEGDRARESSESYAPRPFSMDSLRQAAERKLSEQLRLGDVALLASRGRQARAWHLLNLLTARYPRALDLAELGLQLEQRGQTLSPEELGMELTSLLRRGLVLQHQAGIILRYSAASPAIELEARELEDIHQVATAAATDLLQELLPHAYAQPPRASIQNISLTMPEGRGEKLMAHLRKAVRDACLEAGAEDGPEHVRMVLAMGRLSRRA